MSNPTKRKKNASFWKVVADRLLERCNYGGFPLTEIKVERMKDSVEVSPADGCDPTLLYCITEVADIARAFGLSSWAGVIGGRILIRLF